MTWNKPVLWIVLATFSLVTAWSLKTVGLSGILGSHIESPGSVQVTFDFFICAALVITWMIADARRRGIAAWPWVLATLCLGSFAPLVYLLRREVSDAA